MDPLLPFNFTGKGELFPGESKVLQTLKPAEYVVIPLPAATVKQKFPNAPCTDVDHDPRHGGKLPLAPDPDGKRLPCPEERRAVVIDLKTAEFTLIHEYEISTKRDIKLMAATEASLEYLRAHVEKDLLRPHSREVLENGYTPRAWAAILAYQMAREKEAADLKPSQEIADLDEAQKCLWSLYLSRTPTGSPSDQEAEEMRKHDGNPGS